jgi:hypothetical protein
MSTMERHDTQYKGIIWDSQHTDIQHKDTERDDSQHKGFICDIHHYYI